MLRELEAAPRSRGLIVFATILFVLALVSVGLAFLPAPPGVAAFLSLVVAAVFIVAPVYAVFRSGEAVWTPGLAILFVVGGLVVQVGLNLAAVFLFGGKGAAAAVCAATSQIGLMLWCVGLGALLATLLKEKNLLIPVSLFLAAFDVFLVLTPIGPTRVLLQATPEILAKGGWTVPKVTETPTFGPVAATAYIGPADFVFMAMFAVALYRFSLRPRATLIALIPALVAYMGFVFLVDAPLPAMVPIGIAVLAANWGEFKLTAQEWASTALIVAIAGALILWGATRPRPPAELSPPENVQEARESPGSPEPADSGRSR